MSTNEFDKESTQNYRDHQEIISKLSISTLVKIHDCLFDLYEDINEGEDFLFLGEEEEKTFKEEILELRNSILQPIIKELLTEKTCPHCKTFLFKSDSPQYDYVCPDCDENFYECEV